MYGPPYAFSSLTIKKRSCPREAAKTPESPQIYTIITFLLLNPPAVMWCSSSFSQPTWTQNLSIVLIPNRKLNCMEQLFLGKLVRKEHVPCLQQRWKQIAQFSPPFHTWCSNDNGINTQSTLEIQVRETQFISIRENAEQQSSAFYLYELWLKINYYSLHKFRAHINCSVKGPYMAEEHLHSRGYTHVGLIIQNLHTFSFDIPLTLVHISLVKFD